MAVQRAIPALLILVLGCSGGTELPTSGPDYDSDQARSALVTALEAWKKGEAQALPKRKPAIRLVDDDLTTGLKLSDYEIQEPDRPITMHMNVEVILSLRDARGKTVRREATYQVATSPALAVMRSDR